MKNLAPETVAAQAGGGIDEATGAIVPPLHVATTFIRDPDNQYRKGYSYGRPDNATVRQVEEVLTALEGGAAEPGAGLRHGGGDRRLPGAGAARPRGRAEGHVLGPAQVAGRRMRPRLGIEATFVDAGDPAAIRAGVRPGKTRLVWIETPANPLWNITDIAEAARIAHAAGALLAVDSTVPTPVLTQPIALGADIVMHSAHQVPERPFRRDRGRAGVRAQGRDFGARRAPAQHAGRASSGRSRRRCCCAACAPCTCACATSAPRAMAIAQHFARHPASRPCSIRGCRPSRTRDRGAADAGRLRRHAVDPRQGR